MTNQNPITPPPELVQQWHDQSRKTREPFLIYLANCAARWGTPARAALAQPVLPPSYIDAEHTGQDQELLEVFYKACLLEGGTADEIHLRGLKAVLACWGNYPVKPDSSPANTTREEN